MQQERDALITLVSNYEISPYLAAKVLEHGSTTVVNRPKWLSKSIRYPSTSSPDANKSGKLITYLDPQWPAALFDLDDQMPLALWCNANHPIEISSIAGIAVVGRLTPSLSDVRILGRFLGSELTDLPLATTAAPGINEHVIRAACRRRQLVQVISAAGLSVQQFRLSWKTRSAIAKYGVLISEYPHQVSFSRDRVIRRNRIVAALSATVVLIGAPNSPGTAGIWHWAAVLGRETIAI